MKLIDIHAHLTFKSFRKDLDDVIARAKSQGIIAVIDSSIDPKDFMKALDLKKKFRGYIYITLGAAPQKLTKEQFEETLELIDRYHKEVVAIGEVGLDYYWVKKEEDRNFLRQALEGLIEQAKNYDKPIVIHNREATRDVIEILKKQQVERAVFHAFMGELSEAFEIIRNGWMLSIPTIAVRINRLKRIVEKIEIEYIMLETDSPFLSPIPKTRNEPANIKFLAEFIAKLKGIPPDRVAERTTENAMDFFKLPLI